MHRELMTVEQIGDACIEWCGRERTMPEGYYTTVIHVKNGVVTAEVKQVEGDDE